MLAKKKINEKINSDFLIGSESILFIKIDSFHSVIIVGVELTPIVKAGNKTNEDTTTIAPS